MNHIHNENVMDYNLYVIIIYKLSVRGCRVKMGMMVMVVVVKTNSWVSHWRVLITRRCWHSSRRLTDIPFTKICRMRVMATRQDCIVLGYWRQYWGTVVWIGHTVDCIVVIGVVVYDIISIITTKRVMRVRVMNRCITGVVICQVCIICGVGSITFITSTRANGTGTLCRRRRLSMYFHMFSQWAWMCVALVTASNLAIVWFITCMDVRVLFAIRTIGKSSITSFVFAFEWLFT